MGIVVQQSSGPLPPASELGAYKDADPSFPERTVAMAEANAATGRRIAERAQIFLLVEVLVGRILGALFLPIRGHEAVAGLTGGATFVAITVALITGAPAPKSDADAEEQQPGSPGDDLSSASPML